MTQVGLLWDSHKVHVWIDDINLRKSVSLDYIIACCSPPGNKQCTWIFSLHNEQSFHWFPLGQRTRSIKDEQIEQLLSTIATGLSLSSPPAGPTRRPTTPSSSGSRRWRSTSRTMSRAWRRPRRRTPLRKRRRRLRQSSKKTFSRDGELKDVVCEAFRHYFFRLISSHWNVHFQVKVYVCSCCFLLFF